jgi:hypothetical protein
MRRIFLMLSVLAVVCGTATAGRNANGAMVVHDCTGELEYTRSYDCRSDPGFRLPATRRHLATRSDDAADGATVVWPVAAFHSISSPVATASACEEQNGVYQGDGTTCEPDNPCFGFPTEHSAWGRIQVQLR